MTRAQERLFTQNILRAERLLASQRRQVHRLQALGFETEQSLALLKLMESITEQFYTAWRILLAYPLPLPTYNAMERTGEMERSQRAAYGLKSSAVPQPSPPAVDSAPSITFRCPHCGLALGFSKEGSGTIAYDMDQWTLQCLHPALESPALCQLLPGAATTMH